MAIEVELMLLYEAAQNGKFGPQLQNLFSKHLVTLDLKLSSVDFPLIPSESNLNFNLFTASTKQVDLLV